MMRKYFYITLGVSFFLGLLPTIIMYAAHGFYPHIPLEIVDDTLYYYSRIREILVGHYFIGNPYILEHTNNLTTSFFVADWIYAVPFLVLNFFKLSLSTVFAVGGIFSHIFWMMITGALLHFLYRKFEMPEQYVPWATSLSLLSVLFLIIRPVTMAVVFPFFLLFLIALYNWLKKPEGKLENVLLIFSSVCSFYIYTYLWQLVLVAIFLLMFFILLSRKHIRSFSLSLVSILLLSLPVFIYTWKQIHAPFYFETLKRVGLMTTHLVGEAGLLYVALVLLCLIAFYFLYKKSQVALHEGLFFGIIFLTLLITGASNVVSGKDLEVAVHIGRFTDIFITIFLSYFIWNSYKSKLSYTQAFPIIFILTLYCISLLVTSNAILNFALNKQPHKEYYTAPLAALEMMRSGSQVVLADDDFSSYVPVLTHDTVLFSPNAELYLMSDREAEERYLLSRMFASTSQEQIVSDLRKYAGVGNAVHQANVDNRSTRICLVFRHVTSSSCPPFVTPYSLKGPAYFDDLYVRYIFITSHAEQYLNTYHVQFIVVDLVKNKWNPHLLPPSYIQFWKNDRFIIFGKK